jgi:AcrR family transcriptional regulator
MFMGLAGLTKAELTRAAIVDAALTMAQEGGLESLTIGTVAGKAGLSKSGVFSRVGSREELQVAVLQEYERRFIEAAVVPALREPRGLPRLRALLAGWARWISSDTGRAGCLFISGSVEYDDRPGPVRDAVLRGLGELRRHVARNVRQALEEGQLSPGTDPEQVAFELAAVVLGLHTDLRLFHDERAVKRAFVAFDRLLAGRAAH